MKEQSAKQPRRLSVLRVLIIVIASAVFLYAGYQLFLYWQENHRSEQDRDHLASQAVTVLEPTEAAQEKLPETTTDPNSEASEPAETPTEPSLADTIPLSVDFDILQSENPDIVAWIYCADTPINYPVVQGEDNQYYLRRLSDGSYNASGSIFMDFRNAADLSDLNSLIYGHNMTNDTMFGSLVEYKDQDYYDEHPELWILTKECAYRIDAIAGVVTRSDSDIYRIFETPEELNEHLQSVVKNSTFVSNYDLESVERIVTLSTCSYEYNTARYVIIGNMIPIAYE